MINIVSAPQKIQHVQQEPNEVMQQFFEYSELRSILMGIVLIHFFGFIIGLGERKPHSIKLLTIFLKGTIRLVDRMTTTTLLAIGFSIAIVFNVKVTKKTYDKQQNKKMALSPCEKGDAMFAVQMLNTLCSFLNRAI